MTSVSLAPDEEVCVSTMHSNNSELHDITNTSCEPFPQLKQDQEEDPSIRAGYRGAER